MTNRYNHFFLVGFFFLMYISVHSQNDPLFTQYMQNRLIINPAYAGSNLGLDVAAVARFQNIGLSNRLTTTQSVALSSSVDVLKGGVGLALTNDMIGLQRTTALQVNYAFQKRINSVNIGVGAGVGFINLGLNGSAIITPNGEYGSSINHNDPNLPQTFVNSFSPDFSVGVYIGNKKFFVSASVNHLYTNQKVSGLSQYFSYNHDRNLIISGGYNFEITKKFYLQPSLLVRTNFQKVQFDLSTLLNVYNNFLVGAAFRGYSSRSIDAISFFAGASFKNFKIIYSYDVGISFIRKFNSGSHEISLNYSIPLKINQLEGKYYYNSRYL